MNKTIIMLVTAVLAMAMTTACSLSDDDDALAYPDDFMPEGEFVASFTSSEVSSSHIQSFFASELPHHCHSAANYSTLWGNNDSRNDTCAVINSAEQFRSLYHGTKPLPDIDFSTHTLVVGWQEIDMPVSDITRVELRKTPDAHALYVFTVRYATDSFFAVVVPLYYWAIFPKMDVSTIKVNTIIAKT